MSILNDAVDLLRTIDEAGIQPGAIKFIPTYGRVEIDTWYANGDERAACDAMVELVLGTKFDYQTSKSIGFARFTGTWRSLDVIINASDRAGYCNRVQVGERIEPAVEAQPERVVPVYEWTCNDPIVEAVSA